MKIYLHCICGVSATGTADTKTAEKLERIFWRGHSGPGHAPTDAKGAANARRRNDRAHGPESVDWPAHVAGEGEQE